MVVVVVVPAVAAVVVVVVFVAICIRRHRRVVVFASVVPVGSHEYCSSRSCLIRGSSRSRSRLV